MRSPEAADTLLSTTLALSLGVLAVGTPAGAQSGTESDTQYMAPGEPATVRALPSKEEFQRKLKAAPWEAGKLRLSPWIGLQDMAFVDKLNDESEFGDQDFTLTVGAGLRGYLPAGRRVVWAAHALPEYVWWQDTEAKRRLNGRYGIGLFAFLNRMTLELSQRRLENQSFFSSEIQELTTSRNDTSTFSLELEITRNLSLFGLATRREQTNQEDEREAFGALDRTGELGAIGFRFENSKGWGFDLGFEDRKDDFASEARSLSNSGTSVIAALNLIRPGNGFRLALATHDQEADEGSDFGTFDELTGSLDVLFEPHRRLAMLGYVRRDQIYAADQRYAWVLAERQGARLNLDLDHALVGLFAETGEDDFAVVSIDAPKRLDDVTSFGAALQLELKGITFSVVASRTEYDSNLDGFDRDVTNVDFSFRLDAFERLTSKLIEKLSLGSGDTSW